MRELAAAARGPGKVYLTGGATALLLGFREQTIDIDLKLDPEPEGVFEAIAALKIRLDLIVSFAHALEQEQTRDPQFVSPEIQEPFE
jgi:hypothetical protein